MSYAERFAAYPEDVQAEALSLLDRLALLRIREVDELEIHSRELSKIIRGFGGLPPVPEVLDRVNMLAAVVAVAGRERRL